MQLNEIQKSDLVDKLQNLGIQLTALARELALSGKDASFVAEEPSAFRFSSTHSTNQESEPEAALTRLQRALRPPLPDPRLVRLIIRHRQLRARFFVGDLFADPAWDMLLDLTAARAEHSRVSVTSLCIASGVPPTTALRWITQMTEMGILCRTEDDRDRRRAFIALSDKGADAMASYFASIANTQPIAVI